MRQSYNHHIRFMSVLLSVVLFLSQTGCWSSKEIEELGLTVGTALDLEKETGAEEEEEGSRSKRARITITNQLVISEGAGAGKKGGASQKKAYRNISETGESVHSILREMILRMDKALFGQHLKVMVIGEDLARTVDLQHFLDFFLREMEIRPSCLVLISQGRAGATLESKGAHGIPSFRLLGIENNEYRTTRIIPPMSLAKLQSKMQAGTSFLLQYVMMMGDEIKFNGAAVIRGNTKKLRGVLQETDIDGLMWITGKGKGGLVKSYDKETGEIIMYEVKSMKSKIIPHVQGNNISFEVNIESEGRLSEKWVVSGQPSDNKFLKRAEKAAKQEVELLVKNVTAKMQEQYQADVAGFGNRLRIKYPRVWEKIKKDWDQTFSKVPVKFNVNLVIADYGTSGSNK